MDWNTWIVPALSGVNGLTFLLFLTDKLLACAKRSRIPELVLLWFCFIGGALGGLLGMTLCRHKINPREHPAFVYGVSVLFWLQLAVGLFFVIRGL